jgi:sigma-E factor negative regulatory protein RseB
MRFFVILASVISASLGVVTSNLVFAADAEQIAWERLQKASVAAHALSYQGVFVYQTRKQTKSVQITHMYNGQGEYARSVMLDGSPREVFSQGHDLVIFNPKNEQVVIEKRRGQNMFPATLPLDISPLKQAYTIREGGIERIADRTAQVFHLDAKDQMRYKYRFWVDLEYGLLVRTEMLSRDDEVIEGIGFNQLALMHTVDLDWFQPKIDSKKSYVMEEVTINTAKNQKIKQWTMSSLPIGYRKTDEVVRTVNGKNHPVTHVTLSDGLASVSLFIEPTTQGEKPKTGYLKVGHTNFFSTINNGYLVTVVGEVPETAVSGIANAVRLKK